MMVPFLCVVSFALIWSAGAFFEEFSKRPEDDKDGRSCLAGWTFFLVILGVGSAFFAGRGSL